METRSRVGRGQENLRRTGSAFGPKAGRGQDHLRRTGRGRERMETFGQGRAGSGDPCPTGRGRERMETFGRRQGGVRRPAPTGRGRGHGDLRSKAGRGRGDPRLTDRAGTQETFGRRQGGVRRPAPNGRLVRAGRGQETRAQPAGRGPGGVRRPAPNGSVEGRAGSGDPRPTTRRSAIDGSLVSNRRHAVVGLNNVTDFGEPLSASGRFP